MTQRGGSTSHARGFVLAAWIDVSNWNIEENSKNN